MPAGLSEFGTGVSFFCSVSSLHPAINNIVMSNDKNNAKTLLKAIK
jgi:hypothetical protein